MIRISFVIPAYNIEPYIEECVDSLVRLPLKDDEYEIIIINDGSTDNTIGICSEIANKHTNIKLISTVNNGLSVARNIGLDNSRGVYVCFVDGDDFHLNSCIVDMLIACEKNDLDVIRGKYAICSENGILSYSFHRHYVFYDKVLDGNDFLISSIKYHDNEVVAWLGIYKKDFLISNKIMFNKTLCYGEDHPFFLELLLKKETKIMQTDFCFYAYRYRNGSITKSPTISQVSSILNILKIEDCLIEKIKNRKTKKYAKRYQSSTFYQLTSIYGRLIKSERIIVRRQIGFTKRLYFLMAPYDFHQWTKIFLFTFFTWFVDIVYDRRNK